jgi:DNA modification methylase
MTTTASSQTLSSRVLKTALINWKELQFLQNEEFKDISPEAMGRLKTSILSNNFAQPFYVWHSSEGVIYCLDGFHRVLALRQLVKEGVEIPDQLPATFMDCANKKEAAKLVLIYSSMYAKATESGVFDFLQLYEMQWQEMKAVIDLPEFDAIEFESMFMPGGEEADAVIPQSLQERFIIPPFSVFDTRQGYWQERKKKWHVLFDSQESRENIELVAKSGQSPAIYELRNKMRTKLGREPEWDEIIDYARKKGLHIYEGASVFDPVLCEVLYSWFCPEKADILDPFAGGSVRGIVAGILGHNYQGIDLRPEQVEANISQWQKLQRKDVAVSWLTGDSNQALDMLKDDVDFVFSCPPYHDLEKYSNDPADLSNMDYEQFFSVYQSIISKSVARLKNNRFACFVVGEIRDKEGMYKNFVADTIEAFRDAGMEYYNEIILVNVAGSLPIRIGRQFEGYRKVGKMHQNVLVFYKGDPKEIRVDFPGINVSELLGECLEDKNYQPNIALSVID